MSFFPRTSAQLNAMEVKVAAPLSQYEAIKAKIDRGLNRQVEGDKEVAEGLKEMIQTKAYLKHYKNIGAFVHAEYGKSKSWLYERIKQHLPMDDALQIVQKVDEEPTTHDKKESVALKKVEQARQEEPEKPHIRTADEIKAEQKPQVHKATENGKPKNQLALWKEIEESVYGRGLRLVDDLNRQCPNAQLHGELISWTKVCLQTLDKWRKSVK